MTPDLRIAYILHRFPGFTETFIMRELYWIREHGADVTIFSLLSPKKNAPVHNQARELLSCVNYSACLSPKVIAAQFHYLLRRPGRYLRALAKTVWQTWREPRVLLLALALFPKSVLFARLAERLGIHHIHAHFVWLEGIAAGVATDLTGIPFSIHPHAFGLFGRNRENVRRELENAARIVTISTYHRAYIAKLCPNVAPEEIEIVYCGVEPDWLEPGPPCPRGGPIRLLSVGRLIEKKGHEYLIDACAHLAAKGVDFRCQIAGEGPLRKKLLTRIDAYGLHDRIRLPGALGQDEILRLYQNTDIFALPCVVSRSGDRDGIPVVLMEAMACEVPVVTTPVTGIPDLVRDGETGLLVAPRDARELALTLQRLIADPDLRHRLGRRGRERVLEDFQVRKNAARLAAIFRRVGQQTGRWPRTTAPEAPRASGHPAHSAVNPQNSEGLLP